MPRADDDALMRLFRAVDAGAIAEVSRLVSMSPQLASEAMGTGATRQSTKPYRLDRTHRLVYAGDTALHIAASTLRTDIAKLLVDHGANVRARNRRGAEPLHSASVGVPGSPTWNPSAQAAMIEYLLGVGADPQSTDAGGVTPLHKAVRTRCPSAVRALLAHGADVRATNGSGSTPLHLAVQNTGRGGTGTDAARAEQAEIIRLLVAHGARLTDRNARGKTVDDSITADWIREIASR